MATENKHVEETFANLQKLKPEQLNGLIKEAIKVFHSLQDKLGSNDPSDAKKAIDMATELRDSLEGQMKDLLAGVGVDMDELKTMMKDLSNFNPIDQEAIKQVDEKYQQFLTETVKKEPKKAQKRNKPQWIAG